MGQQEIQTRDLLDVTASGASIRKVLIHDVRAESVRLKADDVAVEDPLEIRLQHFDGTGWSETTICVTMRTPGNDPDLALGYLFSEGVITSVHDVDPIQTTKPGEEGRVWRGRLKGRLPVDIRRLQRNVFTSSSCGVCAAPSIEAITNAPCPDLPAPAPMVDSSLINQLPASLCDAQAAFQQTGGLHAAAVFDLEGRLLALREDVGRHNSMDKLIGSCLRASLCPLSNHIILLSGRTSFELVQKALCAGVPLLAGVGAPSTLAIELARAHNLTLVGFVRDGRYNAYTGERRLRIQELDREVL